MVQTPRGNATLQHIQNPSLSEFCSIGEMELYWSRLPPTEPKGFRYISSTRESAEKSKSANTIRVFCQRYRREWVDFFYFPEVNIKSLFRVSLRGLWWCKEFEQRSIWTCKPWLFVCIRQDGHQRWRMAWYIGLSVVLCQLSATPWCALAITVPLHTVNVQLCCLASEITMERSVL